MSAGDQPEIEKAETGSAPAFLADAEFDAVKIRVNASTLIYNAQSPADLIYVIQEGQVRLFQVGPDGGTRLVSILGSGDWFGLTGLGEGSVYTMRTVAVSSAVLWRFPASAIEKQIAHLPPIARELIAQLTRRLRQAHEAAARLVFDDCNQRLIKTLVHFSESAAASPGEEGAVILHITHQQLAEAVGAARETVSLVLTELRQQKLLRTGRNRVQFNPAALREFAGRPAQAAGRINTASAAAATTQPDDSDAPTAAAAEDSPST